MINVFRDFLIEIEKEKKEIYKAIHKKTFITEKDKQLLKQYDELYYKALNELGAILKGK